MKDKLRGRIYAWIYSWLGIFDFSIAIISFTFLGTSYSQKFVNWMFRREVQAAVNMALGEDVDVDWVGPKEEVTKDGKGNIVETKLKYHGRHLCGGVKEDDSPQMQGLS